MTGVQTCALPISEVDSKAIARTSPLFEQYLGKPLDTRKIRPGGYSTIEDAISDLILRARPASQTTRLKLTIT